MQGVTGREKYFKDTIQLSFLRGLLDSETESRDLKKALPKTLSTEIIDRKQFNSPVVLKERKGTVHSQPLLLIENHFSLVVFVIL